jgi:hypothetical protein
MSTPEETQADVKLAFPLWGIGAAVALWGLLRGRPLLLLIGAGAFFADSDAEPVRRVRGLLGAGPESRVGREAAPNGS